MLVLYHATFYTDYQFHLGDPCQLDLGRAAAEPRHEGLDWRADVLCDQRLLHRQQSGQPTPQALVAIELLSVAGFDEFILRCGRCVASPSPLSWSCRRFRSSAQQCLQLPRLSEFSVWQWLGNLTAVESWRHHVGGGPTRYLMPNTWTLCYEEQFYLVAGLMLAFAPRRIFAVTAILTVVVLACGMGSVPQASRPTGSSGTATG